MDEPGNITNPLTAPRPSPLANLLRTILIQMLDPETRVFLTPVFFRNRVWYSAWDLHFYFSRRTGRIDTPVTGAIPL